MGQIIALGTGNGNLSADSLGTDGRSLLDVSCLAVARKCFCFFLYLSAWYRKPVAVYEWIDDICVVVERVVWKTEEGRRDKPSY